MISLEFPGIVYFLSVLKANSGVVILLQYDPKSVKSIELDDIPYNGFPLINSIKW